MDKEMQRALEADGEKLRQQLGKELTAEEVLEYVGARLNKMIRDENQRDHR